MKEEKCLCESFVEEDDRVLDILENENIEEMTQEEYVTEAKSVLNSITIEMGNCCDCSNHKIVPDPDPYDSFCYDDVANVCKKIPGNGERYKFGYRIITSAERPYNIRKYSAIPDWCPLMKK